MKNSLHQHRIRSFHLGLRQDFLPITENELPWPHLWIMRVKTFTSDYGTNRFGSIMGWVREKQIKNEVNYGVKSAETTIWKLTNNKEQEGVSVLDMTDFAYGFSGMIASCPFPNFFFVSAQRVKTLSEDLKK